MDAKQLAAFDVETRIVPVEQEDGSSVYEVSVVLRWDDQELDVSGMIPSFTVCINVDDLVNEDNFETFTDFYTLGYIAPETEEAAPVESMLMLIPDELPHHQDDAADMYAVTYDQDGAHEAAFEANAHLVPYRHYALVAAYAGAGRYMVLEK